MHALSVLLFILVPFAGSAVGGERDATVEVHLKPISEIREANIHLHDVVQSTSLSAEKWDELSDAVVGPAPLLGFERYITRDQILTTFMHHGYDPAKIALFGHNAVRTYVKGMRIEGSDLRVRGENFLREELLRGGEEDFEIDFIGEVNGITVPRRKNPPVFKVSWGWKPCFRGNVGLVVRILDGYRVLGRVPLRFRIRAFDQVFVVKERIARNTLLRPEHFEMRRVDLTDFHKTPIRDLERLAGRTLCRSMPAGAILTVEDTRCPPVVKKGDLVTVTFASKNLILTAKARAKESGGKGDWIAVENIDTRKLILARITGPSRVELALSKQ